MNKNLVLFFILSFTTFISCNGQLREVKNYYDYQRTVLNEKYTVDDKTGAKDGVYRKYSNYGGILVEGAFVKGKMVGKWTYKNDQGQVYQIENYSTTGRLHGNYEGMLQPSMGEYDFGRYDNGKKVGTWITYYGNKGGSIRRQEEFINGEAMSSKAYFSDGKVEEDCHQQIVFINETSTPIKSCVAYARWGNDYFKNAESWYWGRDKIKEVVYEDGKPKRDELYLPNLDSGYIKTYKEGKLSVEHSFHKMSTTNIPTYVYKSYYQNGKLFDSISHDAIGRYTRWVFGENEVLLAKMDIEPAVNFDKFFYCGALTEYYDNGKIKWQSYYGCNTTKEQTIGTWKLFSIDGTLKKEVIFNNVDSHPEPKEVFGYTETYNEFVKTYSNGKIDSVFINGHPQISLPYSQFVSEYERYIDKHYTEGN